MGKATRWIRSFLLGKKDEKEKKISKLFTAESLVTPKVTLSSSIPKEKRRWSFKRLGNAADNIITTHKRTGSFDSSFINNPQLVKQCLPECDIEQIRGIMIGRPSNAALPVSGLLLDSAAIRIQAAFRSYLARRALRALRGLVKIQALVRGHLVRKQTSETIRCMHALMAIQMRARVQRVQLTDEAQIVSKGGLIRKESSSEDDQFITACNDKVDIKINQSEGASERKTADINRLQPERTEDKFNFNTYQLGRHSISTDEHHGLRRIFQHNSKVSKTKQTNGPFTENSTSLNPDRSRCFVHQTGLKTENSNSACWDYHGAPMYMSKTESSRAKARSRSEPKQRPKWGMKQKSRRLTSIESMNVNNNHQEIQQHSWLIKLHQAAKASSDSRCNSNGMLLNNSSCRNLIAYQPPIRLY